MKYIVIFLGLLFLLSPALIFASEIHGYFHIGYITEIESFYTDVQLNYSFNLLRLGVLLIGGVETLMIPSDAVFRFSPYRNTFYVGTEVNLTEHLKAGWSHECTHPTWSNKELFWDRFAGGNRTSWYVGIEW